MGAASLFFIALAIFFTSGISEARDFLVGGSPNAWQVPTPTSQTLNQWAELTRFQVSDSLVWKLDGKKKDSVLEVSRADYLSCNVSSPISEHEESTTIKLDRAGPYYFVSGKKGACAKGEKMAVVVMAERRNSGGQNGYAFFGGAGGAGGGPSPAMAPNVGAEDGPALAPTRAVGGEMWLLLGL